MTQKDLDEHWADEVMKPALWPAHMLIICDWGCNIYSVLNCVSPDLTIYRMDSNENFMVEWVIEAASFQQWLESWINGEPLFYVDWKQAAKVSVSGFGEAA